MDHKKFKEILLADKGIEEMETFLADLSGFILEQNTAGNISTTEYHEKAEAGRKLKDILEKVKAYRDFLIKDKEKKQK
jgi:hypothetical protein